MNEQKKTNWTLRSVIIGTFVIAAWLYVPLSFIGIENLASFKIGDRGSFGDMFGGATSLFSGLAFAGIVVSIFMQREELELTRKTLEDQRLELALTREVMERQQAEMEEQHGTMELQRFENTFYQLLTNFSDHLTQLRFGSSTIGRNVIKHFYLHEFTKKWEYISAALSSLEDRKQLSKGSLENSERRKKAFQNLGALNVEEKQFLKLKAENSELQRVSTYYKWFYEGEKESGFVGRDDLLGPYFKILYHIFQYVEDSRINEEHKKFYMEVLRAQMTSHELAIIFYHCLSSDGSDLKQFVERYNFLEYLKHDLLLKSFPVDSIQSHRELWPEAVVT